MILCLCFLFAGCSDPEQKVPARFYETPPEAWKSYLAEVGVEDTTVSNSVLLLMRATACSPCLRELEWWNSKAADFTDAEVRVVLLEQHERPYRVFLDREQVQLASYRDSAALALTLELIPTTPFKVYFDNNGRIAAMDPMGSGGNLQRFVDRIENQQN